MSIDRPENDLLGILTELRNKAAVSRYIREAVDAEKIRPVNEDAARKMMKYVPFWA